VKERFDEKIYINYSRKEIVDTVDQIEHDLVREAMRVTGVTGGIEITTLADVPSEGSGLGSSSSVTVGLLNALYAYRGDPQPAERLAQEAYDIEVVRLGKPIGKQDQYIAAFGGLRCFQFDPGGTVRAERLALPNHHKRQLSENLMLFYTNRTRSAAAVLHEQKARIPEKRTMLRQLKTLAHETRERLTSGQLDALGEVLDRGWGWKKEMSDRVSDPSIDDLYRRALDAGALGGKLCGAGAGGFFLLYCPQRVQAQVREALSDLRELPFMLERDGSKVIFNMRRYEWK
ncbi:MAG: GHMP kinase, partial [Candidatus Latescibacteria bacterium]|nr:GHMP kinase [Candidatus Latescibacterota bacterium]